MASASTFFTGSPWMTLRTASSVSLPESVRGKSGTAMILAGTCLAVVWVRMVVRLKPGCELTEELRRKIRDTIRAQTTARHVPARVVAVPDIPRTLSGKLTELAVRNVVHGLPVKNVDALANPQALEHFRNLPELAS